MTKKRRLLWLTAVIVVLFTLAKPQYSMAAETSQTWESNILAYVDGEQFGKGGYEKRLTDEEKLNTYVFSRQDGLKDVYIFDDNVKFIDGSGKIIEKDISLVKGDKGYGMASNDIELVLPYNLSDSVTMKYNGNEISVIPQNVKNSPEAVLKDNSVIYHNVFGGDVHLRYTPSLSGVKEDIILDKYVQSFGYEFTIVTKGLMPYEDEKGIYFAKDKESEEKFRIGSVVAYDAKANMWPGEISIRPVCEGEEYTVIISVDEKFLTSPDTVYPVAIDPSLTVSDNTHGIGAIEDAPVFSGYPSGNFGSFQYNRVGICTKEGPTVVGGFLSAVCRDWLIPHSITA